MKLYIFTEEWAEQPWWLNFRLGIDREAWPEDVLKETYNASFKRGTNNISEVHIEFKNDSDAVMFLLRWS